MLAPEKQQQFQALIDTSTAAEWLWMSGYLAALANGKTTGLPAPPPNQATPVAAATITVVYGTETGNSKKVATQLTGKLKQAGHKTKLVAAESFNHELLSKEQMFILAISTQGEGEPPANARKLYDYLHQSQTGLPQLQYSIVALGSKSYPLFCQAGIDVDTQLKRLQAKPLLPITLCDDDYEAVAEAWMNSLLNVLGNNASKPASVVVTKAEGKRYFKATLGSKVLLNDRESNKKVYHLEFDLPEEVTYTPGNAIGIIPKNDSAVVQKLLQLLQLPPHQTLRFKDTEAEAKTLFEEKIAIHYLTLSVIKKYAHLVQADIPETRMDLYDLLRIYPLPAEYEVQELLDLLNPISPRIYTISSAPNAHPGQIHLTVALDAFESNGSTHYGFGSGYLTQLKPGTELTLFLHQQKNFQLPRTEKRLIMIGAGTGIAPFRSMLAERDATAASGQNWLLWGEENFVSDFYYQTELQALLETGSLHHAHFAFTKNGPAVKQVHQLVLEQSKRLWQWINLGAYIMVSGHKEPMGRLVEEALLQIIAAEKQVSATEAAAYLKQMTKEGRYAKELY